MLRAFPIFALAGMVLLAGSAPVCAQTDERVIFASVVDKNGVPVLDLTEKDFVVREDGQAREVLRVVHDTDPLQVALLVDNSVAMRAHISDLRRAVIAFVDHTREDIAIALITLAARPTIAVDYTTNHDALKKAANGLFADSISGNTFLDGVAEASQALAKRTMLRSAIVAITTTADSSHRQYEDTLRMFRAGGAALHVITLGTDYGGRDREFMVSKATEETGGRNDIVLSSMGLAPKADQLAAEISNQYRVTYARPQRLIPPKTVEVSVKRPDLRARGMLLKTEKERQ